MSQISTKQGSAPMKSRRTTSTGDFEETMAKN